jgi:hypothetical protein
VSQVTGSHVSGSIGVDSPAIGLTHWTQLSLGLTISFSPCSAKKEDRSKGIIRKEGEEEKKGKRGLKMEDAFGTCEEEGSEEKDEARRSDRREREREREKKKERERKKIKQ